MTRYTMVLSDVHLSTLVRSTGPWMAYRQPAQLADTHLAYALRHALNVADRDRAHLTVVLGGDVFDPDAPPNERTRDIDHRSLSRSEDGAVTVMRTILEDHPLVVDALGAILARGHRVVVLPGNHDAQLLFPRVRELVRDALANAGNVRGRPIDLVFRSWFYQSPDGIHVEHGHAYDPFCVMREVSPRAGRLEDTLGTLGSHHVPNLFGLVNPYAIDAPSKALRDVPSVLQSVAASPNGVTDAAAQAVQALRDLLTHAASPSVTAYDRDLASLAQETGVPSPTLETHRALFAPKAGVAELAEALRDPAYTYGADVDQRHQRALPAIARLYKSRAVIAGHTHEPFALQANGTFYGNSGTWAPLGDTNKPVGSFVWLASNETGLVRGALLRMDRQGRISRLTRVSRDT